MERDGKMQDKDAKKLEAFLSFTPLVIVALTLLILSFLPWLPHFFPLLTFTLNYGKQEV